MNAPKLAFPALVFFAVFAPVHAQAVAMPASAPETGAGMIGLLAAGLAAASWRAFKRSGVRAREIGQK